MRRILILYAEWSSYDRDLVSDLRNTTSEHASISEFQFIEVSAIKSMSDFGRYIPGIGAVYQTPAVGIWDAENLLYQGTGFLARQHLRQMYGLAADR